MANSFPLSVLTPEREFYNDRVESLVVESIDGELCILAGHIPLVTALSIGTLKIKKGDEVREAFHSEGFMEVRPEGTVVLLQACEWPEEIDVHRAEEAKRRAEARIEQQKNAESIARGKAALSRALTRIKVKSMEEKYSSTRFGK
ncbi:MAG TPA: ATP synthase F1 subunit epsilon [Candidatus Acidoferrum sp.]|nr:ATP synthase F1 subunit epsilon [Candidatus Acidoferrum sp.]